MTGPAGPAVDEANMTFFAQGGRQGPAVAFDFDAPRVVRREPLVDVDARSQRWKTSEGGAGRVGVTHLAGALALHGAVAGVIVGAGAILGTPLRGEPEENVVEVAFGFDLASRAPSSSPARLGDSAADQKATKTEQQLPQLSKQIAVESAPSEAPNMPLPPTEEIKAPDPQKETAVAPDSNTAALPVTKETPPPNIKTLTPEELARRAERERRDVAKEEQAGTHADPGTGRAPRPSDLPDSPFSSNVDVPPVPDALPQGSLDGKVDATVKGEYTTAARNHIRRFWNLPQVRQFNPELRVEIEFFINPFGRLVGEPQVSKSSGDADYDELAKQTVKDAVPFPDMPKELGARQKMNLNFSPSDANP
jgi:TonB family protein